MDHTNVDSLYNYPFLSDSETFEYVKESKLLVLSTQDLLFSAILDKYGDAAVLCQNPGQSLDEARAACEANSHLVAVYIPNLADDSLSDDWKDNLQLFLGLAHEYNYVVTIVEPSKAVTPLYMGWHLNEADSCMLGLVAHSLFEYCLSTVPEFCSDFRNFSHCETLSEMVRFYELAASNYHGMLHCTAKFLGKSSETDIQEYLRKVQSSISQLYNTTVIGLVFTPRTFGARLKLSSEQLALWGGDDSKSGSNPHGETPSNSVDFIRAEANNSVRESSCKLSSPITTEESILEGRMKSPRHFPNCHATLVCIAGEEEPDFHPVTGGGRRAHMTIGVAPGVSAVTTGTDLLEIVDCEDERRDWPTYAGVRGWLRDYGEGRWVLYLKKKICFGALFSGAYKTQ